MGFHSPPSGGSAVSASVPSPPVESAPVTPPHPAHLVQLWRDVRDALYSLPSYFSSPLVLQGVSVTDLFTFAASAGSSIEQQVVDNLNRLRSTTWDAQGSFAHYRFERQSQRFPDVVLRSNAPGVSPATLMEIELKGWYALAKEGEPTFRYRVTPAVCSDLDLLVVYPWALSNVISGSPFLYEPYIRSARFAAQYKNYFWEHVRSSSADKRIRLSSVASYYPIKSDAISDVPHSDSGGNFGRIARTGIMDDFTAEVGQQLLAGIPTDAWRRFFRVFTENPTQGAIDRLIDTLDREQKASPDALLKTDDHVARLRAILEETASIFAGP